MLKACDTIRAPGLSWRVSIGRSFAFDDASRIERHDRRGGDIGRHRILEPELHQRVRRRRLSRWRWPPRSSFGSMSMPTPRAPYFLAAAMGIRRRRMPRS